MSDKKSQPGVYVNIPAETDRKLGVMAKLMPRKNGKRVFKKDIIATACELYVEKFFSYLEGADGIDEMMDRAKEIDPNAIELTIEKPTTEESASEKPAINVDLLKETAGLKDF